MVDTWQMITLTILHYMHVGPRSNTYGRHVANEPPLRAADPLRRLQQQLHLVHRRHVDLRRDGEPRCTRDHNNNYTSCTGATWICGETTSRDVPEITTTTARLTCQRYGDMPEMWGYFGRRPLGYLLGYFFGLSAILLGHFSPCCSRCPRRCQVAALAARIALLSTRICY